MCIATEEAGPDAEQVVVCLAVPKYLDFERAEVRKNWFWSWELDAILEAARRRWPLARRIDVCANNTFVGGWYDSRAGV